MRLADARKLARPNADDRRVAAECQRNGGSITAEELAWTRTWNYYGNAVTGARARRWAAADEARTGVPHVALPDGSVYRLRKEGR